MAFHCDLHNADENHRDQQQSVESIVLGIIIAKGLESHQRDVQQDIEKL